MTGPKMGAVVVDEGVVTAAGRVAAVTRAKTGAVAMDEGMGTSAGGVAAVT